MWNTPLLTPLLLLLILLITVVVSSRYVNALWNPCSSVGKCALKIIFSSDSSKEVLKHNIKTLTFTYPLSARVVGATQRTSQPVPSIFLYLRCPLQFGELQACPLPGVVFQSLLLSSLSSPPFTVPCKMGLARPHERETWPHPFSLLLFAMVRSSYSPIVCWVLARTSPLVTWSLMRCVVSYDSTSIPWLFFFFWVLLWKSTSTREDECDKGTHQSREMFLSLKGRDKGAHQSYLGTDRNAPVIPSWFQPCLYCCRLCCHEDHFRLRALANYDWAR